MPKLEISLLIEQDISEYAEFLSKIWNSLSSLYSPAAREAEAAQYTTKKITEYFHNADYLLIVGKVNGKIVAGWYALFDANTLFLYLTGVAEGNQRQGIGTKIHEFTFNHLRANHPEVRKVWCDTIQSNVAGINVLKKIGFALEGDLKKHWYGDDYFLWGYYLK